MTSRLTPCRHAGPGPKLYKQCIAEARRLELQYPDPCEWNPDESRPAWFCEVHASAEVIVGAQGRWRLCKACADLPAFQRFTVRREVTP